jgi:hypothetical protein
MVSLTPVNPPIMSITLKTHITTFKYNLTNPKDSADFGSAHSFLYVSDEDVDDDQSAEAGEVQKRNYAGVDIWNV